jgi:ABC-2 type transport system permease protein
LAAFGGNYFAFAVLGVAMGTFLSLTLGASGAAVQREQSAGTFEALLAMPISPLTLVLAGASWAVFIAAAQAALYLVIARQVFGLDFYQANLLSAAFVFLIAAVILVAIGTISSCFVLLFRQSDPIVRVLGAVSALLAGVFYPTSVLPPLLQRLSYFVPLTYALRAFRLAMLKGYGVWSLRSDVGILLAFLTASGCLAAVILPWVIRQARRFGAFL